MDNPNQWQPRHRRDGRIVFGVILAGIGTLFMLQMLHVLPSFWYSMHFGWPIILIIVGIAIGAKNNFRNNAWWILVLVGAVNLVPSFRIGDVPSQHLLWPVIMIMAGLFVIFRKHGPHDHHRWQDNHRLTAFTNDADAINIDATFCGRKEIITSRNFKGGIVRATFSGVELNLTGADSTLQPMVLDVYASFSGVEIIVPSHWELQNEIRTSLGNVEDNRTIRTNDSSTEKRTLILRGSISFGSVEVKSY